MSQKWIKLNIAGSTVITPTPPDPFSAQAIAEQVTERIRAIEEESERIDTQGFALRAAWEFALELEREKTARHADERELIKALDAMHEKLQQVLERHGEAEEAP